MVKCGVYSAVVTTRWRELSVVKIIVEIEYTNPFTLMWNDGWGIQLLACGMIKRINMDWWGQAIRKLK
jgi:hypothetical protein